MTQPARRARAGRGWLHQFPAALREVAAVRWIGSVGAGGVLYLTPLVFHQEQFSASQVTLGVAVAALVGTGSRFVSGVLLDRGVNCAVPVLLAVLASLLGDARLFSAEGVWAYLVGQMLQGTAMGLYWPAIELAVPLACAAGPAPIPSGRGYALVRTADALGIASGALLGAGLSAAGQLRGIYLVDIACVIIMGLLLLWRRLPDPPGQLAPRQTDWRRWLSPLLPVLLITLVATSLPALMQSALPLDLVSGGLQRPAFPESLGALLIGLQLGLLLLLQWPVGQALAQRPVRVGLSLSLLSFAVGTALLAASSLSGRGVVLVLLAQLPLAFGEAAFLPIATEAVIELTPEAHQGLAMALFSQCFALSAFGAPLLAGLALDAQDHGAGLW
ncbi:MAG: MFS transporter, partial [Cyanobacteriota bacterium]